MTIGDNTSSSSSSNNSGDESSSDSNSDDDRSSSSSSSSSSGDGLESADGSAPVRRTAAEQLLDDDTHRALEIVSAQQARQIAEGDRAAMEDALKLRTLPSLGRPTKHNIRDITDTVSAQWVFEEAEYAASDKVKGTGVRPALLGAPGRPIDRVVALGVLAAVAISAACIEVRPLDDDELYAVARYRLEQDRSNETTTNITPSVQAFCDTIVYNLDAADEEGVPWAAAIALSRIAGTHGGLVERYTNTCEKDRIGTSAMMAASAINAAVTLLDGASDHMRLAALRLSFADYRAR